MAVANSYSVPFGGSGVNSTKGHVNRFTADGTNIDPNGTGFDKTKSPASGGLPDGPESRTDKPSAESHANGSRLHGSVVDASFEPIAIYGMACRLPGGVNSPNELWDFLIDGRDGRVRTPQSRYNIDGYYSAIKRTGTANTEYGYFLDNSVDLAGLDATMFSMSRVEVEWLDPQQRMLLEVARESLDDAGEVG
jgi:hypothetical protein